MTNGIPCVRRPISPQLISGTTIIVWISAFLHLVLYDDNGTPPLVTDQQQGEAFLHRFIQQPIIVTWKNDSTYLVNLVTVVNV